MSKKKSTDKHLLNLFLLTIASICLAYVFDRTLVEARTFEAFTQENISVSISGEVFTLDTKLTFKPISPINDKKHRISTSDFLTWLGITKNKQNTQGINLPYLEQNIKTWEQALELTLAQEGSVAIEKNKVTITLPREGQAIDQKHLERALFRLLTTKETNRNYTVYGRIIAQQPKTHEKELKKLKEDIEVFLSRDFVLKEPEFEIEHVIDQEELPELIEVVFDGETKKQVINIRENYLQEKLLPYNQEVRDAEFVIEEDDSVIIIPSKTGIMLDVTKTETALETAIKNRSEEARIHFLKTEPDLSTEDAEALNITHPIVSFTTYYACCEARAKNIEAVAKIVDGALVYPDEEWNLNTFIGKRTLERGFLPAGTIVKGTMIETTGGGISQFATTFYNTVYWGGFQDVQHTPHSRYFSRYPEGIEATISWPLPHLIFKNNSSHGILIQTKTTSTSVTVRFFGNNDGRYIQGKHKDGQTTITAINEGGENARIVSSLVDNKTEIYPPKEVYYVDPLVEANAIFVKNLGRPSYSVDVTRTIEDTQGKILETKKWKTFYLSEDKEYLVKDCSVVPEGAICKTKEDIENEKKALEEFFLQIENTI